MLGGFEGSVSDGLLKREWFGKAAGGRGPGRQQNDPGSRS